MYDRHIMPLLDEVLSDTPVLLINGARQTGKTTLVEMMAREGRGGVYVSLDDVAVLAAAKQDPAGFIAQFDATAIIDEVQRAPELFLPLKRAVDLDRRPGRFILTGSANILTLPRLADSLAGRMEIVTLWPLSQGEIEGRRESFIDDLFTSGLRVGECSRMPREELVAKMLRGGYPPVLERATAPARQRWFSGYRTTLLERDVRDLSLVRGLTDFPRLLAVLATRAGQLLNLADISRNTSIQQDTLRRYYSLLEAMFLIVDLPAWSSRRSGRLGKTPEVMFCDTGLLGNLLVMSEQRLAEDPLVFGAMLENFVVMELRKQATWSSVRVELSHYRDLKGREVDIVLENEAGEVVGVEVKATASPTKSDLSGLARLREASGKRFRRGVLLYTGTAATHFADDIHIAPVQMLWRRD